MVFIHRRKHIYGPPRPVTEIALLFYMQMRYVYHRKYTYGPPRHVTEIILFFPYLYWVDICSWQQLGFSPMPSSRQRGPHAVHNCNNEMSYFQHELTIHHPSEMACTWASGFHLRGSTHRALCSPIQSGGTFVSAWSDLCRQSVFSQ
jgi:hypothetical protein